MSWYLGQVVKGPDNKPYVYYGIFDDDGPFGFSGLFRRVSDNKIITMPGGVRNWYASKNCHENSNCWKPGFTEYRNDTGKVIVDLNKIKEMHPSLLEE